VGRLDLPSVWGRGVKEADFDCTTHESRNGGGIKELQGQTGGCESSKAFT